jgi:hypothetical protein
MSFNGEPRVRQGGGFTIIDDSSSSSNRHSERHKPSKRQQSSSRERTSKKNNNKQQHNFVPKRRNNYVPQQRPQRRESRPREQQKSTDAKPLSAVASSERQDQLRKNGDDGISYHPVKETGKWQTRNIHLVAIFLARQFKGGVELDSKLTEQEHHLIVKFFTEAGLLDGMEVALKNFVERMIPELEGDSTDTTLEVVWKTARDGISISQETSICRRLH